MTSSPPGGTGVVVEDMIVHFHSRDRDKEKSYPNSGVPVPGSLSIQAISSMRRYDDYDPVNSGVRARYMSVRSMTCSRDSVMCK